MVKIDSGWDTLGSFFKTNAATFQCMIHRIVQLLRENDYKEKVKRKSDVYTMFFIDEQDLLLKYHLKAHYAVDVIFKHLNYRAEMFGENCHYCSGNHHGLKTEISVLSNGIAIGSSNTRPGLAANIKFF